MKSLPPKKPKPQINQWQQEKQKSSSKQVSLRVRGFGMTGPAGAGGRFCALTSSGERKGSGLQPHGTLQLSEGVEVRGPVLEVGWAGESAPTRQLPCFDMALFYLSPIRAPCLQSVRVNFTSLVKCASCGNAYCSEKYLRMHPRLVRL